MSAPVPGTHTPGPWAWFGNAKTNSLYLATTHSGRRYVMSFTRWGMRGAQPQFQPRGLGLVDASQLLEFAVGDRSVRGVDQAKADDSVYRLDITGIDCADARLIASAPALLEAAQNYMAQIGQGYEAHGLPFGPAQQAAHERLTQAIASATGEA